MSVSWAVAAGLQAGVAIQNMAGMQARTSGRVRHPPFSDRLYHGRRALAAATPLRTAPSSVAG